MCGEMFWAEDAITLRTENSVFQLFGAANPSRARLTLQIGHYQAPNYTLFVCWVSDHHFAAMDYSVYSRLFFLFCLNHGLTPIREMGLPEFLGFHPLPVARTQYAERSHRPHEPLRPSASP